MLLTSLMIASESYKIIQKSEDGRYYLDEETVLALANYIAKLEDLNSNYKLQISNLESQVATLKDLLTIQKSETEAYKSQVEQLKAEVEKYKAATTTFVVVSAIAIGAVIILFVK